MNNRMVWSGVEWSGVEWSGVEWSGVEWSGVEWSGVEWRYPAAVSMVREDEIMMTSMSVAATTTYKTHDDMEREANAAGAMMVST
eukprot:scaffold7518_cov32-Attheya_sp.AAC.2